MWTFNWPNILGSFGHLPQMNANGKTPAKRPEKQQEKKTQNAQNNQNDPKKNTIFW